MNDVTTVYRHYQDAFDQRATIQRTLRLNHPVSESTKADAGCGRLAGCDLSTVRLYRFWCCRRLHFEPIRAGSENDRRSCPGRLKSAGKQEGVEALAMLMHAARHLWAVRSDSERVL